MRNQYDIDEKFQVGMATLKCVEIQDVDKTGCSGCFFEECMDCAQINNYVAGPCIASERYDNRDVIFVID